MLLQCFSRVAKTVFWKKLPRLDFWIKIGVLRNFLRLKRIDLFKSWKSLNNLRFNNGAPGRLQMQQLRSGSLDSPWKTSSPEVFVFVFFFKLCDVCLYCAYAFSSKRFVCSFACFVLKVLNSPNSPSGPPMLQFLIISFHSS